MGYDEILHEEATALIKALIVSHLTIPIRTNLFKVQTFTVQWAPHMQLKAEQLCQ